jgi:hypothetical protein
MLENVPKGWSSSLFRQRDVKGADACKDSPWRCFVAGFQDKWDCRFEETVIKAEIQGLGTVEWLGRGPFGKT